MKNILLIPLLIAAIGVGCKGEYNSLKVFKLRMSANHLVHLGDSLKIDAQTKYIEYQKTGNDSLYEKCLISDKKEKALYKEWLIIQDSIKKLESTP